MIPEAVDSSFAPPSREVALAQVRARFDVSAPYVLYVGQFDPRKNMDGLVAAFARAAERYRDLRLVIAGDLGKLAPFLHSALEAGARRAIASSCGPRRVKRRSRRCTPGRSVSSTPRCSRGSA